MLLIECPWCGPRDESEFAYGGEADISRPIDPDALSDAEWADYLFMRSNRKGENREIWNHQHGCRRWFVVERDTVSYAIRATFPMDGEGRSP
ncbi:MAG: sarcosine oxidase subunit delta family protein [Xanthomonadales bacterium]|nr:sarcosine oxidase subunit delta family protein [Xanthomonadales bacterium]NIN58399.1 sarcosine oxidase subunit delta family protein [Xanthomonadales bacterium]NIN73736.1 sarcosine oxidase subunit delta family protein [Xanthomonadales bacterium]NIO14534.1 sarcosine oxidase subunit delta family protein [Xanthomonadales bacterium]NIP10792.1 sarcosine oxidase subunit delta family protein [Xanthomonadales bacterium]